jgi:hypothetical protein
MRLWVVTFILLGVANAHLEWGDDSTILISGDSVLVDVVQVDECFLTARTEDGHRALVNMCPVEHKEELPLIDPDLSLSHKYLTIDQIKSHEKVAHFPYQITIKAPDAWFKISTLKYDGSPRKHVKTKDKIPLRKNNPEVELNHDAETNRDEYFDDAEAYASRTLNSVNNRRLTSYVNNQRVVELAILNDYHRHIHLGNDTETTQIDTRAIVLLADMLYADGGFDPHVRIQLSESIITDNTPGYMNLVAADGVSFTTTTTTCGATSNEIGITENSTCAVGDCASGEICAEDYLNEARTWRGGSVFTGGAPDVVQVLSGLDFSGGTQGLARLGSACDQFNGIGNVIRVFACVFSLPMLFFVSLKT